MDRRTFMTSTTAAAIGLATNAILPKLAQGKETMDTPTQSFWPDNARLVISVSMQFETGSQPDRGAGSPFPPLDSKYPDLPVGKWYEYGFKEGVPRLLDLWDRVGIKVTSHMVGQAVERHPELAKEIVGRGHEASGHGQTWEPQYSMTPEQERAGNQASIDTIQRATGTPAKYLVLRGQDTRTILNSHAAKGFFHEKISKSGPGRRSPRRYRTCGRRAFCERGRHHGLRRFAQVYRRVGKRDRDLR